MVKDHSDNKIRNLLPPLQMLLFYMCHPSHRQDSTYHSLCYTSCGALAEKRNSSMSPPQGIDPTTHCTMNGCSTTELHLTPMIITVVRSSVVFVWFTLGVMRGQTLLPSLHWIDLMTRLVYPIMILNIVSTNIFLPLSKMIGTVRSWTSFILSSQFWEIGSPPTGGAGRMK